MDINITDMRLVNITVTTPPEPSSDNMPIAVTTAIVSLVIGFYAAYSCLRSPTASAPRPTKDLAASPKSDPVGLPV